MSKVHSFIRVFQLAHGRQFLLLKCIFWLNRFWWLLRKQPFDQVRLLLPDSYDPLDGDEPHSKDEIEWAVRAVSKRFPWTNTCLFRAFTSYLLMSDAGYPVRIVIGVHKENGVTLDAHAWVTDKAGKIVAESIGRLDSYHTLTSLDNYSDPIEEF